MSKTINCPFIILILLTSLLPSCKKHSKELPPDLSSNKSTGMLEGLPPLITNINGYFFAECAGNVAATAGTSKGSHWQYAVFAEPSTSLCATLDPFLEQETNSIVASNIAPGEIIANNDTLEMELSQNLTIKYQLRFDTLHPDSVSLEFFRWTITGNGSFPPSTYHFESPFPRLLYAVQTLSMSSDSAFILRADNIMKNYDSLRVAFVFNPWNYGVHSRITFHDELNELILSENELSWLKSTQSQLRIRFKGYKYFHKWENGKLYLFQFSTSREIPLIISP